ncbi:MAG: hypothetical protein JWN73_4330 [Betaproteobacteria bacterium]|nr:hypothetical protein [Betaproteobacteria bacterium]
MKKTTLRPALLALGLLGLLSAMHGGAARADTGKITGVSVPGGFTVAANGVLPVTVQGTGKCAYKLSYSDGMHNYGGVSEFITAVPTTLQIQLPLVAPAGMLPGNYTVALSIFPAYQYPCGSGSVYSTAFKVVAPPPPPPPPPGPPGKLFGSVMFDKPVAKVGDTVKVTVIGEGACAFALADDGAHGQARAGQPAWEMRTLPYSYQITPPAAGNFKFVATPDSDAPAAQRCAGAASAYLQVLEDNKRPDLRVAKGPERLKDEVTVTVEDNVYKLENHERYFAWDWVVSNIGQADSTPTSLQVTCALTSAASPRTICQAPTRTANVPALKPGQSYTVVFGIADFRWHHGVRKTWETAIPNSGQQVEHHDTGLISDHPAYHGSIKAALRNVSGIYISDLADNDNANNASSVSLSHD